MNAASTSMQKRGRHRSAGIGGVLRGCFAFLVILTSHELLADDTKSPAKGAKPEASISVSSDQEAQALAFAGEHHPELKSLVESLKTANPAGYKKAIHDLHRASDRLMKLNNEKSRARYEHELALWKLDSRIRLTAARSAMKDSEELRAELKALVQQRRDLHLAWLKADKERAAARVAKLEAELKDAESKNTEAVDAEVERLLKSVKSTKPKVTAALKDNKKKDAKPKGEAPPAANP